MAGYIRQDVTNNIADGNVINASDFDNEYNAIESAFHATTGHTHDGTSAEGAPITKIGPAQDIVAGVSSLTPKTDNTVDLGSSTLEFKDLYIDGTANIDSLVADTADINAGTIDGVTIGGASAGAGTFTTVAATTGNITTVNATTVDTTNIEVTNIKAKDGTAAASIADSTGVVSLVSNPTLSAGTANGVLYLNGSKVATSGSALTFDGTNLGVGGSLGTNAGRVALTLNATTDTILSFGRGGSLVGYILQDATGQTFYNGENTFQRWYVNSTEQMRLTGTGLGIGTSSPGERLNVVGGGSTSSTVNFTGGINNDNATIASDYSLIFQVDANNNIGGRNFGWRVGGKGYSDGTSLMDLDSSGNLGLGVTPSAWTLFKALELGNVGTYISGRPSGNQLNLAVNTYYNSGSKYANTGVAATMYEQEAGAHKWYTAPSGTAGNAISFTQALTLDANRNLLLNGTTAGASSVGTFTIFNGTAPTGSVTDGVILFAQDIASSSELRVRDEAGNVTTLSPHNFSLIPEGPSEDMAWAYYSEKGGKRINVDMLKLARMVEKLTGEKLVYEV